jgi:hypothetical protein
MKSDALWGHPGFAPARRGGSRAAFIVKYALRLGNWFLARPVYADRNLKAGPFRRLLLFI